MVARASAEGEYIIRESERRVGTYTVVVCIKEQAINLPITQTNGSYYLGSSQQVASFTLY